MTNGYDDYKLTSPYEHESVTAIAAFYEVEESEVTWGMRDRYLDDVRAQAADRRNET